MITLFRPFVTSAASKSITLSSTDKAEQILPADGNQINYE